jgi:hypothetical protein
MFNFWWVDWVVEIADVKNLKLFKRRIISLAGKIFIKSFSPKD